MSRPIRTLIQKALQQTCPIRAFFGFDEIDEIIRHKKEGIPFLYSDHAYFNRGYDNHNFRCVYNDIHLTRLLDVDKPRFGIPATAKWRQGENVIFIPGASNPLRFLGDAGWNDKAIAVLSRSKRNIVVKAKKDGKLKEHLKNAWCLVTHSSVAGVEAAVHGIPVFGPQTSPSYPVSNGDISDLENPVFPDREPWLRSLTYAQYTLDEMKDGTAWSMVNEHQHLRRA